MVSLITVNITHKFSQCSFNIHVGIIVDLHSDDLAVGDSSVVGGDDIGGAAVGNHDEAAEQIHHDLSRSGDAAVMIRLFTTNKT